MKSPFTIYRLTRRFIENSNKSKKESQLFFDRTSPFSFNKKGFQKAVDANNEFLRLGLIIPCALVDCAFENLFETTNTINRNWTENAEVTVTNADGFMSSTSVGDIFSDADGVFYIVTANNIQQLKGDGLDTPLFL